MDLDLERDVYVTQIDLLEAENKKLREELDEVKGRAERLEKLVLSSKLIEDDDDTTRFYTGFSSYLMFMACFNLLKPSAAVMRYWQGSRTTAEDKERKGKKPGPQRKLPLIEEFFLWRWYVFVLASQRQTLVIGLALSQVPCQELSLLGST